jgi:hypothetical protein
MPRVTANDMGAVVIMLAACAHHLPEGSLDRWQISLVPARSIALLVDRRPLPSQSAHGINQSKPRHWDTRSAIVERI